jgi:hypothetical protein
MKTMIIITVLFAAMVGPAVAFELSSADDFPIVGRSEIVTVAGEEPVNGLSLWVVYSPNSETTSEEEIGVVPAIGEVSWTPSRSGIATLSVRDDQGTIVVAENVAILFDKTPAAGVMVMIFAGLLLFGSAGFSMRSVLKSGVPEHNPPIDT